MPIPIQYMHQNQILDGLERSSETIHMVWMVSEGLLRPSTTYIWSRTTFRDHPKSNSDT